MKRLKEDVRKKILINATNEFYEKGFSGASMRKIARTSKMVVGNVYRYFKSKEALFTATVSPAFQEVVKLISLDILHEPEAIKDNTFLDPILNEMAKVCAVYPKEIVIILDRYIGTKNYTLLEDIKKIVTTRIKKDLPNIAENQVDLIYSLILRGVLHILQNTKKELIEEELKRFFIFLFKDIQTRII